MTLWEIAVCACVPMCMCVCLCTCVSLTGGGRLLFLNRCAWCLTYVYLQADCRRRMKEALCDLICLEHLRMFLSRANRNGCLPLRASALEHQLLMSWMRSLTCVPEMAGIGERAQTSLCTSSHRHVVLQRCLCLSRG